MTHLMNEMSDLMSLRCQKNTISLIIYIVCLLFKSLLSLLTDDFTKFIHFDVANCCIQ